jgi:hypothetical protein
VLSWVMDLPATSASGPDRAPQVSPAAPAAAVLNPPVATPSLTASFLDTMGQLIDDIAEANRAIARATATRATLIEQARSWSEATASLMPADESIVRRWNSADVARRSLVSEVAAALRVPDRTAENLIHESQTLLRELPATMKALTDGDISYRHAQVMIDHADSLPESGRRSFEKSALPFAAKLTASRFDRKARVLRERAHPESIEVRQSACRDRREFSLQPGRDGMSWLSAYLPAASAQAIHNRVTDVARTLTSPDEQRTLTQLRADVFCDLLIDGETIGDPFSSTAAGAAANPAGAADGGAAGGGAADGGAADGSAADGGTGKPTVGRRRRLGHGIRARVLITVPVLTLLGRGTEPAVLEGYGPIDIDTARELAAGAPGFVRVLTHPETGAVLSLGRDRYPIPPDLRAWLRMRDETCRAPGCGTAARHCDIDHTTSWEQNGLSNYDNLAHLCPKHHDQKHHTRWSVKNLEGGELEWVSPTGHRYLTEPATQMPVGPGREPPKEE